MATNKIKDRKLLRSIENHETASWANCERQKPVSNVSVPSELEITNAKEYVDENEK